MAQAIPFIAVAAISAGTSIYKGYSQKKSLEDQAEQQRDQARLARLEAEEEAGRREEERDRFLGTQRVAFASNGIRLNANAKSSLAVLDDTKRQFNMEIDAIRRRGKAQEQYSFREAEISDKKGKAALLSGFLEGAEKVVSAGVSYKTSLKK